MAATSGLIGLLFIYFCDAIRFPDQASIVTGYAKAVEPNLGEFPFQASLMQVIPNNGGYHSFCGGSLIHPTWVLTAAHCIQLDASEPATKASDVHVALGSIYRNASNAQIIRAAQLTIHGQYLTTDRHDIGIVRLQKAAKLGRFVNLVPLHINNQESLIGKTAYLTGFGIINDFFKTPIRLRKATFHIGEYRKCFAEEQYKDTEVCAISSVSEGKACKGDSGGPLTIKTGNKYTQIGITSHLAILPFCQITFNHSVYTRVSAYIAWISKETGINFMTYRRG